MYLLLSLEQEFHFVISTLIRTELYYLTHSTYLNICYTEKNYVKSIYRDKPYILLLISRKIIGTHLPSKVNLFQVVSSQSVKIDFKSVVRNRLDSTWVERLRTLLYTEPLMINKIITMNSFNLFDSDMFIKLILYYFCLILS